MPIALPILLAALPADHAPKPGADAYRRLAAEVRANLQQDVLSQWFPRAIDPERGGFRENFGEDWSAGDGSTRSIVYQARLTWVAAEQLRLHPNAKSAWRPVVQRGMAELESFWDPVHGGLYWAGRDGAFTFTDKHAYGMAFAMYASAAAFRATRDRADLTFARKVFDWLDVHAHDGVNGGYYEAFDEAGEPILGPDDVAHRDWPHRAGRDAIGTVLGQKSMNTHIHLLEALSALYEANPDASVRRRLAEVFGIVRDKVATPAGYLHMFFSPDWRPTPGEDSYGHDIETAYLLVEAAAALGKPDDRKTWALARRIVDHTLAVGCDARFGGVYDSGTPDTSPTGEPGDRKVWWVQAEALNALLLMHERYGRSTRRYWDAFVREWGFIQSHQVDHIHHGWYRDVARDGSAPAGATKSDGWTEAYHQGRALMNVEERLRRLADRS